MSGAYHMAQEAARMVKIPVHVVDAKGPTMTLGWQVLEAVRLRELGESVESILSGIDSVRRRLVQIVGMDSLSFLQKGGRIGDAASWLGARLQIKPVVSINHETGRVEPEGIARTHSGVLDMVYRRFSIKSEAAPNCMWLFCTAMPWRTPKSWPTAFHRNTKISS